MKTSTKFLLISILFVLPYAVNAKKDSSFIDDLIEDLMNFIFSAIIGKCMKNSTCAIIVTPILVILFIISLPSCIEECKKNPGKSVRSGCISGAGYYIGNNF